MSVTEQSSLLSSTRLDSAFLQNPSETIESRSLLDQLLNDIGYGKYQNMLLFFCGLGWMTDCMWLQAIVLVLPQVQKAYGLNAATAGIMLSCTFLGMLIGALIWGEVSDRYGRKWPFANMLFVTILCGLLSFTATTDFSLLCLAITGVGIGVGGHTAVDSCMFLEFCPSSMHHRMMLLTVFFSFGTMFSAAVTLLVVVMFQNYEFLSVFEPWRVILGVVTIGSLIIQVCRHTFITLQETPKFLLEKGHKDKLHQVLNHLIKQNNSLHVPISLQDIDQLILTREESNPTHSTIVGSHAYVSTESDTEIIEEQHSTVGIRPISRLDSPSMFDTYRIRTTLLLGAIWILISLGFTMFNAFIPAFMEGKHPDLNQMVSTTEPLKSEIQIYIDCMVYASSSIPAVVIALYLVSSPIFQMRGTLAMSCMVSAGALCLFIYVQGHHASVLLSSSLINIASAVVYGVLYAFTPAVYPTSIRARVTGLFNALGRM
ncbi:hypothetical protein O5D80_004669 [Batrachochytrium dendrobatidis]|nr:hypothetical protein O5D80_004669 [Batrachochytrium dendrobatidis]